MFTVEHINNIHDTVRITMWVHRQPLIVWVGFHHVTPSSMKAACRRG
jgi:hypothetical protein